MMLNLTTMLNVTAHNRRACRFTLLLLPVWVITTLLTATLLIAPALGSEEGEREYKLKAAYLYHFAKFTTWKHFKEGSETAIDLCVTNEKKFFGMLKQISGRDVGKKKLQAREVAVTDDIQTCEILFVNKEEEANWEAKLSQHPDILTVGETRDFLHGGGIIQFYILNEKLRFAVHIDHLRKSQVTIESRMLRLAERVKGGD